MTLNIKKLNLIEIEMPLKARFETSFGVQTARTILLAKLTDSNGVSGWSECTAMEQPLFNHETVESARSVIRDTILPALIDRRPTSAAEVEPSLRFIRGNRMAIATVETAMWDLEAKQQGVPLWRHLGGTRDVINTGVSIGLQPSIEQLLAKVELELSSGYQRIKIKIKPGSDIELVKAVRAKYPDILLSVDANSAYDLDKDVELFKQMGAYNLLMIEQPLAAGDIIDHARLQKQITTPLCLDESITKLDDARQALEEDACRIINIKLGRVGGHSEAKRIQAFALERGIPVWCGGMLETGIGRAHNIAVSTLPGYSLPGDVSASARYWAEDIIQPEVTVKSDGTITPPETPGIGFTVKEDLIRKLAVREDEFEFPG